MLRIKMALILASAIIGMVYIFSLGSGVHADPNKEALPPSPVSLTNPDGQALDLERYDLRVAVHGPLALTEMEMVFRNPQDRQMEGRFLYLLPPGATVSRFAKEVNGKLMEGEVVERQRARRVYRQILHTMRDPALLEQDQGNRFSAKVFPIPAKGTVRLLLSYSQTIAAKDGLRELKVPMAGMPSIGEFSMDVAIRPWPGERPELKDSKGLISKEADGVTHLSRNAKKYQPQKDLVVLFHALKAAPATRILSSGGFRMISYRPTLKIQKAEAKADWVFAFDTSASNADTQARRLVAVSKILEAMKGRYRTLQALAFDLEVVPLTIYQDPSLGSNGTPKNIEWCLQRRHALGATDLAKALRHFGEQARKDKKEQRFVLVSDGIATWGKREVKDVLEALGDWPKNDTLHALVLGAKQDRSMLKAIVERTRGRIVTVGLGDELNYKAIEAVEALCQPLGATFEFYDEAAEWIYPRRFQDVRAGQELVAFAKLKKGKAAKPGVVHIENGSKKDIALAGVKSQTVANFAPLLEREACRAYIEHLTRQEQATKDDKKRIELRKQRLEVSIKNRVLCPLTALLVLETEQDYDRFGLNRNALGDILAIDSKGIAWKKRSAKDLILRPSTKEKDKPSKLPKGKKINHPLRELVAKKSAGESEEAKDGESRGFVMRRSVTHMRSAAMDLEGQENDEEFRAANGDLAANLVMLSGGAGALVNEASTPPSAEAPSGSRGESGQASIQEAGGSAVVRADESAPATPARSPATPREEAPSGRRARRQASEVAEREAAVAAEHMGESIPDDNAAGDPENRSTRHARRWTPPPKLKKPDWVKGFGRLPSAELLSELHAKVAAKPRNRNVRNSYAEALVKAKKWDVLQAQGFEWLPFDPENPQVFEFLGLSATNLKDKKMALRAYASIAEVAPNRAALLARAGWLMLVAREYDLAEQMFRAALAQRKDNPNIHRGLALSLWLSGTEMDSNKLDAAAKVLEGALKAKFNNRYGDLKRVFKEELGYIYRAMLQPDGTFKELIARAKRHGVDLKRREALRVTLCWETDANDVDLHIVDPKGEECFYSHKKNASGLELYSDQTQGLGPEIIRTKKALSGIYHVGVKYYSAGPMGVSRGVVVVMRPDKNGVVARPEIRPFCLVPNGQEIRYLIAMEF